MEPIAVIGLANTVAVLIYEAESDYVVASFAVGDSVHEAKTYEIQYELPEDADEEDEYVESEPVFYMGKLRMSLNEAMRLPF